MRSVEKGRGEGGGEGEKGGNEGEKNRPQPPIAISSSSLYFPPKVKGSMVEEGLGRGRVGGRVGRWGEGDGDWSFKGRVSDF